jgi:phospholipid transport system substrate-binding protein
MLKLNDTWKVYDIIVLGVSGVKNYRAQLQTILLKQSPEQVIGLIENRIKKKKKGLRTSGRQIKKIFAWLVVP